MWRGFQIEKSLANPAHPFHKFGTGSKVTLWDDPVKRGQNVRDELLKFHKRYYSANVMKLVVLGRESLDQLTDYVVDKFSPVPNKNISPPEFAPDPLLPEQLQTQVFYRAVKDVRALLITFPIPDQNPYFKTKPAQFLSHLIGHEGPGSILSLLKARGWSNHFSAGATDVANGFGFFKISVDLTPSGMKEYESVLKVIFDYIELLKTPGSLQDWAFEEVKKLSELDFKFKEKERPSSYASELSSQMQRNYPREWILSGPYLPREFNKDLIRRLLEYFTPQKCRIYVTAQSKPDGSEVYESKERWYGTEYTLEKLPDPTKLDSVSNPETGAPPLALPHPNLFIPENFEVPGAALKGKELPTMRPVLVRNTPTVRLWHKQDDRFFRPKAQFYMDFKSPLLAATPANAVKSRMLVELLKDALTEYSYDAELAGLWYNLEASMDGLGLSVHGYNDKLPDLVLHILKTMRSFSVDPTRFELIKDQVVRMYENFKHEAPYQHANYYTTYLLMEQMWTPQDKLAEVKALAPEEIQAFLGDVLRRTHMEMLVHGNMSSEAATKLAEEVEAIIAPGALSEGERASARSLLLPWGKKYVFSSQVGSADEPNSAIEYYLQVGDLSDRKLRAHLAFLTQILNEPVFDILRTKEQLGYLVFSSDRVLIGSAGWRVLVQSEQSPEYVESRIDAFLRQYSDTLDKMAPEEFERHRASLIHAATEADKSLAEESTRYWYHISSQYYDFLRRYGDVEEIKVVTHEQIKELFARYLHPDSPHRAQLVTHIRSQQPAAPCPVPATPLSSAARAVAEEKLRGVTTAQHPLLAQLAEPSTPVSLEAVLDALAAEAEPKAPAEVTLEGETPDELAATAAASRGTPAPEPTPAQPTESLPSRPVEAVRDAIRAVRAAAADHPAPAASAPPTSVLAHETVTDPVRFRASLQAAPAAVPKHDWAYYAAPPERDPAPSDDGGAVSGPAASAQPAPPTA